MFTYLLGAGASADAIPVVSKFSEKLRKFGEFIDGQRIERTGNLMVSQQREYKEYIIALQELLNEVDRHYSIDTYAKKLYLSNHFAEYGLLKCLLSDFLYYQHIVEGVDKRYDAFLATILSINKSSHRLELPDNIRILSWNYDKQLEYSLSRFFPSFNSNMIDEKLNLYPRKTNGSSLKPSAGFSVFKLNGTIQGTIKASNSGFLPYETDFTEDVEKDKTKIWDIVVPKMVSMYQQMKKINVLKPFDNEGSIDEYPSLLFSWEDLPLINQIRDIAKRSIQNTEILIIIGYSFPTFNRIFDKALIESMNQLLTVYVQIPGQEMDGVIQRFKGLIGGRPLNIKPIPNIKEFYLPFEF